MASGKSGAIRAGRAFVEVFADNNPLERGLKAAEGRMRAFGSKVSGIGQSMVGTGAAIAAPFVALGGFALKSAADMETLEVAFGTMLGSAEAARKLMQELVEFGAATPFELPELAEASKKLLAFGVGADEIRSTLTAIGDISSGIGAPIGEIAELYGKARVQGRLFAEDINQLTGRGIPIISELAKQFGVTESEVRGLVESGKVNFGNLETAFRSLTSEGGQFAGMMEAQSGTLNGLFSTLQDSIGSVARAIGGVLLEDAKRFASAAIDVGERVVGWIESNRELIATAVKVAVGIAAAGVAIAAIGSVLVAVGLAATGFAAILGAIATAVGFLLSPLGLVVAGVVAGVAAFLKFTEAGQTFTATLGEMFGAIVEALMRGDIQAAVDVLWTGIQLAWAEGSAAIKGAWIDLQEFLAQTWTALGSQIASLWIAVSQGIVKSMANAMASALQLASDTARQLGPLVGAAGMLIGQKAGAAAGGLREFAEGIDPAASRAKLAEQTRQREDAIAEDAERQRAGLTDGLAEARANYAKALEDARAAETEVAETAEEVVAAEPAVADLAKNARRRNGGLNTGAVVGSQAAQDAILKGMNSSDPQTQATKENGKKLDKAVKELADIRRNKIVVLAGAT